MTIAKMSKNDQIEKNRSNWFVDLFTCMPIRNTPSHKVFITFNCILHRLAKTQMVNT